MERENITGNTLIAESVEIATLVDYQRSTVVSRTIIERNAGSVTLFDFDKGQGLSEHTAPFDALACILDGEANITIRSPARQEHAYSALVKGSRKKPFIHLWR